VVGSLASYSVGPSGKYLPRSLAIVADIFRDFFSCTRQGRDIISNLAMTSFHVRSSQFIIYL